VTGLISLLVVVCFAIGLFTDLALNRFLMNRLDDQLTAQGGRQIFSAEYRNGSRPAGSDFQQTCALRVQNVIDSLNKTTSQTTPAPLNPNGSQIDSIGMQTCSTGESVAVILQLSGNTTKSVAINSTAKATLAGVKADGHPRTVSLSGYGQYRAVSQRTPDGSVQITALPLSGVHATLVNLAAVITIVTLIGLIIAGFIGAFIVRLALRPLRRVTSTATKVAEMPLDEGEVALAVRVPAPNPHTEVGQVGVALNRMLENVSDALNARHQSETRVRQFVADASHELRTPLASIRGYAELTRRSREAAPPDIAHAMTRVESEANRMTTLVEDLLLLARLDEGRPLDSDEVDLTRLTVDVVSDAHVAGRDHQWNLDLGEEPISVRGDGARLHQVLVNLLANARTHTPAGTNVWISLSEQGPSAILRVADDGPGIPAEQMPNIFERFSRGEQSRSRAAGSTGLGLAIVAAVISAHGGRITVESEPGNTVFTVTLPTQGNRPADAQTLASLAGQIEFHDGRNSHRTGSLPTI
jgi:two-component system OmpR family sensor kinase